MAILTQTPWGISADGGQTLLSGVPIQTAMQNYVQQAIQKAQAAQPAQVAAATPQMKPLTLPPPMQTGWGAPGQQAGGMSLSDILNGPQFGSGGVGTPPAGTAPPPVGTPPPSASPLPQATMPNPNVPQQNFQQFGQNLMQKILAQQGGGV